MHTIDPKSSALLMIDFQARLMPAIDQSELALANAGRLTAAAALLGIPAIFTEQNARGLGPTVQELAPEPDRVVHKMAFDASRSAEFTRLVPDTGALVVAGCEAHVCVLQTVLGLIDQGRRVYIVRDAVGSRRAESKAAAIDRMARHGAEIVTTEMVVFEWLESAEHPRFREAVALIK
jgi:nicotinamidase-related amidase